MHQRDYDNPNIQHDWRSLHRLRQHHDPQPRSPNLQHPPRLLILPPLEQLRLQRLSTSQHHHSPRRLRWPTDGILYHRH